MNVPLERGKPPHAFVLLLFFAAAYFAIADAVLSYFLLATATDSHSYVSHSVTGTLAAARWRNYLLVRNIAESALRLLAVGVAIALLDRVRWLLTPEAERAELARRYLVSRIGRAFGRRPGTGAGQ